MEQLGEVRRTYGVAIVTTLALLGAALPAETAVAAQQIPAAEAVPAADTGSGAPEEVHKTPCQVLGYNYSFTSKVGQLTVRVIRDTCTNKKAVIGAAFRPDYHDATASLIQVRADGRVPKPLPPQLQLGATVPPQRNSASYPSYPGKTLQVGVSMRGNCNWTGQNCLATGYERYDIPGAAVATQMSTKRKLISW